MFFVEALSPDGPVRGFVNIPSSVSHDRNVPCSENFSFQSKWMNCKLMATSGFRFDVFLHHLSFLCLHVIMSLLCSSGWGETEDDWSARQIKFIISTISNCLYNLSRSLKERWSAQSTRNINFPYLHICLYIFCVWSFHPWTQQQFAFALACRETRLRGEKSWLTGFICSRRTLAGANTNESRCINGRRPHCKRRRNRTCC